MTNGEIFRKAAGLIRTKGWYGGPKKDPEGDHVCALVALDRVEGLREECGDIAARRVGLQAAWELPHWNNAPERTAEQVIALFEDLAFDEDLKAAAKQASELNDVEPSPSLLKEAVPV